jgi:hypothetical protein
MGYRRRQSAMEALATFGLLTVLFVGVLIFSIWNTATCAQWESYTVVETHCRTTNNVTTCSTGPNRHWRCIVRKP